MVDATVTNTTSTTTTLNHSDDMNLAMPSTNYLCSSCHISFKESQQQRAHMRSPWHAYNIKRRVALLHPISLQVFQEKIEQNEDASRSPSSSSSGNESDNESNHEASPFQCLFCSFRFDEDLDGIDSNLEHMRTIHGFTIPDLNTIVHIESFLEYLATEIRIWHECLYCGATKSSTQAIQAHMRDTSHSCLNFDREPELKDFWDRSSSSDEDDGAQQDEAGSRRRLPSGKIIGSKESTSEEKSTARKIRIARSHQHAIEDVPEDADSAAEAMNFSDETHPTTEQLSSSLMAMRQRITQIQHASSSHSSSFRNMSKKEELSLIGVAPQQRQALITAIKKAQRSEQVAQKAQEWANNRGANTQKHDQMDTTKIGKRGKQTHKLLPR